MRVYYWRRNENTAGVKKYIRERKQSVECNILLPELAAAEVVKCVQYMWMDIEIFKELLI